jgi:hypothetical protein
MKKILAVVGLAALMAGCASSNTGMGGTGDESMRTDSLNENSNGSQGMGAQTPAPSNSTWGEGGNTAPNNGTGGY